MRSIKKILCAVDLSEFTALVAEYAVTLAKAFGAELTVLYAAPPLNQYAALEVQPKAIEMFVGELSAGAEKNMQMIMAKNFSKAEAVSRVVVGYPAEEIIKAAKEGNADLIVMGTHGRKGVDLILFGSVAEKVVKSSTIPVLTINPNL